MPKRQNQTRYDRHGCSPLWVALMHKVSMSGAQAIRQLSYVSGTLYGFGDKNQHGLVSQPLHFCPVNLLQNA